MDVPNSTPLTNAQNTHTHARTHTHTHTHARAYSMFLSVSFVCSHAHLHAAFCCLCYNVFYVLIQEQEVELYYCEDVCASKACHLSQLNKHPKVNLCFSEMQRLPTKPMFSGSSYLMYTDKNIVKRYASQFTTLG